MIERGLVSRWALRSRRGVLAGAGALIGLVACGGISPAPPAPKAPSETGEGESVRPAGGVRSGAAQAQLYVVYPPTSNEDKRIFRDLFDQFSRSTGDRIRVTYDDSAGQDVDQRVTELLAAGGQVDSMRTHPTSLARYAARGVYLPTDDLARRDNAEVRLDDFVEANLSMHEQRGKHYGLPYYAGPSAMYFNRDLFDRYGLAYPDKLARNGQWTWGMFVDTAVKLTQGTGQEKTFGINTLNRGLQYYLSVPIWANGGDVVDDLRAPTRVTLDEPAAVEALSVQAELQITRKVTPDPPDLRALGGAGEENFRSGRIGMLYAGRYRVPDIKDVTTFKIGHMPLPTGKAGRFMRDGGNGFTVMTGSKLREEAWRLVKFAASPEGGRLLLTSTRPQPVRKSFYADGTFEKALLPWERLEFYLDGAQNDRIFLLPEAGPRFQQPFESAWDKMVAGQMTIKQVVAVAVPAMNALLQDPGK